MTLIIGILCKDGVVIAADGAATYSAMGQPTIRQPITKLRVIQEEVILGVSGPVGLSQRFGVELQDLWSGNHDYCRKYKGDLRNLAAEFVMDHISHSVMRPHIQKELQAAQIARGVIGDAALSSAISASLVAMPLRAGPSLFIFDQQGAPECASRDLPFYSIGSGQATADPFLAFIRRIFWQREVPTVNQGMFAALWALEHVIEVNPGGVSQPVQMIVIQELAGKKFKAIECDKNDLAEHYEAIRAAEDSLRGFESSAASRERAEMLPLPTPPPSSGS